MTPSTSPADRVAILGAINPASQAAGTVSTGWFPAKLWGSFLAIVQAGALGANATVDAKLEQAKDAAGASAKDIAGKSITQLTKTDADDNKQAEINLRQAELDIANGFTHVRLSITVATAACLVAGLVIGLDPRFGPASDYDAASVDSIA
ncbi:hypothetical protein [Blastochloris tepida]|uniref:Uncharacterized protein n=1 Tax=Blastochloris tepida TaxID=2233851 RepID=A0A348G1D9_9HYPH|nr:hypothetical protein [Blastochloris tepida]BBF93372.1 hypothetical protein BLTE_20570 [Blastochloris tepida]